MSKLSTLVGPLSVYPERANIRAGDELTCKKVFDKKYGKTVQVFNKDDVQVGFLAARLETVLDEDNHLLADEIFDDSSIKDEFKVTVIRPEDKVFEVKIENDMEENKMAKVENKVVNGGAEEKFKLVKALVEGSKRVYPKRYDPIKLLKNNPGTPIAARIEHDKVNQKVLVYFTNYESGEEDVCGHIVPPSDEIKGTEYRADSELLNLIEAYKVDGEWPRIEAQITEVAAKSVSSISLVIELKIFGQTAMEAALEEMQGDIDKDKFDEMSEFISSLKISEQVATEMFKMVTNSMPQDASRVPTKTVFNNSDEVMEDVVYSIVMGSNTMLEGPMAAGKNTCLETLAYHFGKALYEVQVNSYIDNDVLLGTRTIVAKDGAANAEEINKQGRKLIEALAMAFTGELKAQVKADIEKGSVEAVEAVQDASGVDFSILINAMKDAQTEVNFQPGVIPIAMETGSWVVVDEFNAGPPAVMAVLNSVLDNRKRIQVPGYGLVKAAEGFRLFATMNPNYEGTFTLNPATSSRFNHVTFKASETITPIILSRVPNANKDFLKVAEKCYKELRNGIEAGKNQEDSINVRGFIEAAKMNVLGRSVKKSLLTCVVNGIPDMDDRKAMKDFIDIQVA